MPLHQHPYGMNTYKTIIRSKNVSKNIFGLVLFRFFIVTFYDVLLVTVKRESIQIISNT